MGLCVAPLDCDRPKAIDLGSTRLGNGMAAPLWATLGLQEIRRVFRQRRSTQLAAITLAVS
jgi:hypothetical protein